MIKNHLFILILYSIIKKIILSIIYYKYNFNFIIQCKQVSTYINHTNFYKNILKKKYISTY